MTVDCSFVCLGVETWNGKGNAFRTLACAFPCWNAEKLRALVCFHFKVRGGGCGNAKSQANNSGVPLWNARV